jgi:OFA family oxalate/formate antiporter-like MFS transporter
VNRYLILLSAFLMQMCLGATYSWSVYVQPLKALTGLNQGPVQLPFSLFYFAFPATMIFTGSLLPRIGPRICALIGGLLFGAGWILAGLGGVHFAFTVAGIGILAGVGVGFAYIVPIATCIRWFPDNKGLVTGIAVAGFGGGAALVSQIGGWLMSGLHLTPFATFACFGVGFLAIVLPAGWTMQNPPGVSQVRRPRLNARSVVGSVPFALLYLAMFTGLAAGFTVNANLKELFTGGSAALGVTAVSLFALTNALGRVTWGAFFDRFSAVPMLQANLLLQAVLLLAAPLILFGSAGLLFFAALAGFNYGGILVLYASCAARIWGAEQVGQVYGWLFSANIPAAIFPVLAGYGYDRWRSFTIPLCIIAALLLAAAIGVQRLAQGSGPMRVPPRPLQQS